MTDDIADFPVLVITDEMVSAGHNAIYRGLAEEIPPSAMAVGVFIAMIHELEGGKVLFSRPDTEETFRFQKGK